jgi:hypothetical protein
LSTKEFIHGFIDVVFEDFKANSWCEINEFELSVDSYMVLANQQKYILKYYAAYFCEYYELYNDFLKRFGGKKVNIISIGCGPGIDCDALNRVIKDNSIDIEVKYLGIDLVDWAYKPEYDGYSFEHKGIDQLTVSDVSNVDLIVFPKSLTEINSTSLERFATLIAGNCNSTKLFFLNTYVTDAPYDSNRVDGVNQFQMICDILIKYGFTTNDKTNSWFYISDANSWLGYYYNFFKIPDNVRPFVEKLKSNCEKFDDDFDECRQCNIDFIPVMRSNYLASNLIEFNRI